MLSRYVSQLIAAAVLFAIVAAPAWAQQREASVLYEGPAPAVTDRGGDLEEVHRFDPNANQVVLTTAQGGYVFGTNGYGDLGKSVALELPSGWVVAEVTTISMAIFRNSFTNLEDFRVAAWAGNGATGPLEELGGQDFPITAIDHVGPTGPIAMQDFAFDDPVVVGPEFHALIEWDASSAPEDLGIGSSEQLSTPSIYEWEAWDDGVWRSVADSWGASWHVWISAVVQDVSTSGEPGAQPEQVTLSAVFPNPVVSMSSVEIVTDRAQHVSVEVFNLLGQRVLNVFEGTAAAGMSILPINGSELAPGMYVIRLQGEDFSQSRKFVVAN